jgi:hypothetical protein
MKTLVTFISIQMASCDQIGDYHWLNCSWIINEFENVSPNIQLSRDKVAPGQSVQIRKSCPSWRVSLYTEGSQPGPILAPGQVKYHVNSTILLLRGQDNFFPRQLLALKHNAVPSSCEQGLMQIMKPQLAWNEENCNHMLFCVEHLHVSCMFEWWNIVVRMFVLCKHHVYLFSKVSICKPQSPFI